MFLKIDNIMFDKVFQPFADWFCDRTGQGPLWLAGTAAYMVMVTAALTQMFLFGSLILNVIMFLIGLINVLNNNWKHKHQKYYSGTLNPKRHDVVERFIRISFLVLTIYASLELTAFSVNITIGVVLVIQGMSLLSIYYFEACETKPPAPPKKKEFKSGKLAHSPT